MVPGSKRHLRSGTIGVTNTIDGVLATGHVHTLWPYEASPGWEGLHVQSWFTYQQLRSRFEFGDKESAGRVKNVLYRDFIG